MEGMKSNAPRASNRAVTNAGPMVKKRSINHARACPVPSFEPTRTDRTDDDRGPSGDACQAHRRAPDHLGGAGLAVGILPANAIRCHPALHGRGPGDFDPAVG